MHEPLTRAEWEAQRARVAKSRWLRNALQGWRDPALTMVGIGLTPRQRMGGILGVAAAVAIIVATYALVSL